jgi:hypothetical protein
MLENQWKLDRWFIVAKPISLPGDYNLVPRNKYQVQESDRIYSNAGTTLRIGGGERKLLEPYVIWLDTPISPDLARLITQYPTAALVRGLVRAELGIAPPRDQIPTTAEGWFEFVKSTPLPARPTKAKETTIDVRVQAQEQVYGHSHWSRMDHFEGTLPVPADLLREGDQDEIEDWIRDHIENYLDRDYGEEDSGDSDTDDSEGIRLLETDLDEVLARLEGE